MNTDEMRELCAHPIMKKLAERISALHMPDLNTLYALKLELKEAYREQQNEIETELLELRTEAYAAATDLTLSDPKVKRRVSFAEHSKQLKEARYE